MLPMFRPTATSRTARQLVAAIALGSLLLSGCSTNRFTRNGSCGLIGAGLGGAAGIIYTVNENYSGGEVVGGAAIGAAIGAAAAYGICVITD